MINIFNEVFTDLTNTLSAYNSNIKCSSVYTNSPSHYPFVSLEEIDNSVYELTSDCCEIENHASIDLEVNVFTNNQDIKKSEADKIANVVDELFKSKGLVRRSRNVFQSTDETTYRIIVRYSGIVSKDHTIYRR